VQVGPGFNGKCLWEVLEMYNNVVRQVCRKEKTTLIDLAAKMPKSSSYYYDHSHFTNQGAQKVAEIVAADLIPVIDSISKSSTGWKPVGNSYFEDKSHIYTKEDLTHPW
ncbi:MAG: hypothetical protein JST39_22010, partial [Bacteroidetes bacterium]|nr:hypothetical protein [Bacteroidota bacterium]